jgi:hypothetical protein
VPLLLAERSKGALDGADDGCKGVEGEEACDEGSVRDTVHRVPGTRTGRGNRDQAQHSSPKAMQVHTLAAMRNPLEKQCSLPR